MKAALFSKLTVATYLVVAGLSGCGDSGGDGANNGTQGAQCQELTGTQCPCPDGSKGFSLCSAGQWGPCTCNGAPPGGAGGFGNNPPVGGGPPVGGQTSSVCGDGQITGQEQCDGQNHNGQDCQKVSMGACNGGYLICTAACLFDYSACVCGAGGQGGAGGMGPGGTTGIGGSVGGTTGQP